MAALGNVLSFISIQLAPIAPSVPLGPVSVSLAFDLSHIATFVAALFGGPAVGALTGLVGGLVAAFQFGFSQGNFVTGIALPLGKAATGLVAGILVGRIDFSKRRLLFVPATVIAYVPEGVFTAYIFASLYPVLFGMPQFIADALTVQILVKATIEMVLMGLIVAGLYGNGSFVAYARSFFPAKQQATSP
jgi:uncharacterized membrane protein